MSPPRRATTIDVMNDTSDTAADDNAGDGPDPAAAPTSRPIRRLVRSRSDRKVAGVAGGLGAYFHLDPVVFRLGFVLAAFFGGSGLLAYAIAWIVLPEGDTTATGQAQGGEDDTTSLISLIVGGFLLVLGMATLFDLADIGFLWPASWPMAMIVAGIAVIAWARRRSGESGPEAASGPPSTPPATPPATPPSTPVTPEADLLPVPYQHSIDDPTMAVDDGAGGSGDGTDDGDTTGTADEPVPDGAPSRRSERQGISATALAVSGIFLFVGVATLGHLAEWWDLAPGAVFGGALVLCGAGLVASAWLGRGLMLVPLGILCALGLVAVAWIDVPIRGGIGDRTTVPTSVDEIDDPFRLAIGSLELDLSRLDFEGDVAVEASVAIGELRIVVPDDVALEVDARSGMGQVVLEGTGIPPFTRSDGGIGSSIEQGVTSDVRPDDVIELEADVGMGQVVIQRVTAPDRDGDRAVQPEPPPSVSTIAPTTPRFGR